MSDLSAFQDRLALGLLGGDLNVIRLAVRPGPIGAEEAFSVHRNTALHGLVNALRISHPTVDALVGEAFFDQVALAYVSVHPPSGLWLTGYGEGFADFLQTYPLAADLPYLPDVARFDFAVEAVAGLAFGQDGRTVDLGEAWLSLDASLTLIDLDYDAAAIRDALDQGDEALAALDVNPLRHGLALWRRREGAGVRRLSPVSAAFVRAIQQDADLDAAVKAYGDLAPLQSEVFSAPFVCIAVKSNLET